MAKVITCSQYFPKYHPEAGGETFFVEKILNSLGIDYKSKEYIETLVELNRDRDISKGDCHGFWASLFKGVSLEKNHTVRAKTVKKSGEITSRWKVGDKASLRVWSGNPYCSPQIIIAPDVEIVKIEDLEVSGTDFYKGGLPFPMTNREIESLANSDGLTFGQFLNWFEYPKQFKGEIIYWKA